MRHNPRLLHTLQQGQEGSSPYALWLGKDITLLVDHDQRRTPGLGKVIIALFQVQPKGQPPQGKRI